MAETRSLHLLGATGKARVESVNGKEHLVVPVLALMEGVIHAVNADNPEYVPSACLAKAPDKWEGQPVVLGHPVKNGRQISAHDPEVLEQHQFGVIRKPHVNQTRLGMEALVDPDRLMALGRPDVVERLREGDPIEVSVGAFVRTLNKSGEFLGKPYKAEWEEIMPDHLAFLPDGRGACSIAMGCGSGRFAQLVTAEAFEELDLGDDAEFRTLVGKGHHTAKWHDCWEKVKAKGHDDSSAAAICTSALGKKKSRILEDGTIEYPFEILGGRGSGFHGHSGRPGKKGGSASSGSKLSAKEHRDADSLHRQMQADIRANDRMNARYQGDIQGPGAIDYEGDNRYAAWEKKYKDPATHEEAILKYERSPVARAKLKAEHRSVFMDAARWGGEGQSMKSFLEEHMQNFDPGTPEFEAGLAGFAFGSSEGRKSNRRNYKPRNAEEFWLHDLAGSLDEQIQALNMAVQREFGNPESTVMPSAGYAYAQAVYPDYVIIRKDDQLLKVPYIVEDGEIVFDGDPVEVKQTYVEVEPVAEEPTITAAAGGSEEQMKTKDERAATIKSLLENPKVGLTKEDAKWLEQVPDERLDAMVTLSGGSVLSFVKPDAIVQQKAAADAAIAAHAHSQTTAEKEAADKAAVEAADKTKKEEEPNAEIKAAAAKFQALEQERIKTEQKAAAAKAAGLTIAEYEEAEYLKTAPPSVRALVERQKTRDAVHKNALVAQLKTAASNIFTEDELKAKPIDELEKLAKMAKLDVPEADVDYSGRGVPRAAAETPNYDPPDPYAEGIKALQARLN